MPYVCTHHEMGASSRCWSNPVWVTHGVPATCGLWGGKRRCVRLDLGYRWGKISHQLSRGIRAMETIAVRVFAAHPVVKSHYTRVLAAAPDFCLTEEDDRLKVGVFDGEMPSFEAVLSLARLKYPSMRPLLLYVSGNTDACLRWLFR